MSGLVLGPFGCATDTKSGGDGADAADGLSDVISGTDSTDSDVVDGDSTQTNDAADGQDAADGTDAADGLSDTIEPEDVEGPTDLGFDAGKDTNLKDILGLPELPGPPDTSDGNDINIQFPDLNIPQVDTYIPEEPSPFERITVSETSPGAAYVEVGDLDLDGKLDLVVSSAGAAAPFEVPPGQVEIFRSGDDITTWTASPLVAAADDLPSPSEPLIADVDEDGDADIILPAGSAACSGGLFGGTPCGAILWFEQDIETDPPEWIRHEIVPKGAEHFFTRVILVDLDGDAINDLVTVGELAGVAPFPPIIPGEPGEAAAQWFKGTAELDRFETTPHPMGNGLGALPVAYDIDDDGDMDFLGGENHAGLGASFAWFEQDETPTEDKPDGGWIRHLIADSMGPATQFALIPDFYADGLLRGIGTNRSDTGKVDPFTGAPQGDPWESAVFAFEIPEAVESKWDGAAISEKIQSAAAEFLATSTAPGGFDTGDLDGDGDIDIVVGGDGDPRVFWMEQTSQGAFTMHILEANLLHAGGIRIRNLDEDEKPEVIVTGGTTGAVYIYRWVGLPPG